MEQEIDQSTEGELAILWLYQISLKPVIDGSRQMAQYPLPEEANLLRFPL